MVCSFVSFLTFFFFKQKTAYEFVDCDWSSDVCSSDLLKAAFRVLTLKLGRAKVPMVVTNHTYDVVGSMFPDRKSVV